MTVQKPFRIAVVNSHPIQYFAPLYAYLNRDPELEITALYCSDSSLRGGVDEGFKQPVTWDVDLLEGYRVVFLGERAKKRTPGGFFSLVSPELWNEIDRGKYDAVWLHGYAYAAYVLAFLAARRSRLPVFVRGETHLGLQRTGWRRRLRDAILGLASRQVAACLAIGSANRAYYRSLGVPEAKIFDVPYTVDNARFMEAASVAAKDRSTLRKRHGLPPDQPVVLYASKFEPRKHPRAVIDAVARLRDRGMPLSLLLVGSGELEAELRARVAALALADVVFTGFVNQAELPAVYAAADVFVLASENEPWGLIVNEVMCAGLPVVVADEVGCVPDLVENGGNGRTVPAGDATAIAAALREVLHDEERREAMGQRSLEIIRGWSYADCLDGVKAAVAALRS